MDSSKPEIGLHGDKKTHHHASSGSSARASQRQAGEKRGGSGAHNWGRAGEVEEEIVALDSKDPNFDPEEQAVRLKEYVCPLNKEEVLTLVEPMIREYFETGDVTEAGENMAKVNSGQHGHLIIETAILLSLDRTDTERELASALMCELLSREALQGQCQQIERAFSNLLSRLGDLKLDVPDAPEVLGKFMARAVADDCLPPAFVKNHPAAAGDFADPVIRAAIKKANTLLTVPHAMSRLDEVWGHNGAIRPVDTLVSSIHDFLNEYLTSEDAKEAQRCLVELGVPHFHHEVVYEAILKVLEHEGKEREARLIANFLAAMGQANIITPNQMEMGVRRVYSALDDLQLDIPKAAEHLEAFLTLAASVNALSASLCAEAPTRASRKRYLSENDGGRIKDAGAAAAAAATATVASGAE